MRKLITFSTLFIAIFVIFSSFETNQKQFDNPPSEFELLVQYLEENGNFINSEFAPALIEASELKNLLKNKNNLVLDIRSESWFEYGHIKKAVNIKAADILDYMETKITPADYEKITIVCYSGQSAAYFAGLLRLAGYNNVYSLKWGMSSWAEEFAENIWIKNTKEDLTTNLETVANSKPEKGQFPILETGKIEGNEILTERIKAAFAKPYKEFIVKTPAAMEAPADYFIVNYMGEEKYNTGHLKGAIHYTPNKCLASTTSLATLPVDKKILINCETGQSAAYAVAYLHILGYDVYNLAYGNNSYMNKVMAEKGWNAFTAEEIKNLPIVE